MLSFVVYASTQAIAKAGGIMLLNRLSVLLRRQQYLDHASRDEHPRVQVVEGHCDLAEPKNLNAPSLLVGVSPHLAKVNSSEKAEKRLPNASKMTKNGRPMGRHATQLIGK